jgi:hypothetical protein
MFGTWSGESILGAENRPVQGSSSKAVLYEEVGGEKYEVDLPLSSSADVKKMMQELELPPYIDLNYFPMKTAIVITWASQRAPELHKLYPRAYPKQADSKPIPALLFGGAAMKVHCEHSNGSGALSRSIKDTDFIVPKKQGGSFCRLLLNLDKAFGSQFKFFRTRADTMFNAMRQGNRYRIRNVNGITKDGAPSVTVLDILCDSIEMRHEISVKDSFDRSRENLYTIGLENLILSKAQFIADIPKTETATFVKQEQDFRFLSCDWFPQDKAILGMEEKDIKDVTAIFLDHAIGQGKENIDPAKMRKILEKDRKMALTVMLNLQNVMRRVHLLEKWLTQDEVSTIADRIQNLLSALPKIDKKWDKPWWNTSVETPKIE